MFFTATKNLGKSASVFADFWMEVAPNLCRPTKWRRLLKWRHCTPCIIKRRTLFRRHRFARPQQHRDAKVYHRNATSNENVYGSMRNEIQPPTEPNSDVS